MKHVALLAHLSLVIAMLAVLSTCGGDPPSDPGGNDGPQRGSIALTVTSSGQDVPAGYTVVLDGTNSQAVDSNGSVSFADLLAGNYSLELTEVPENCQVAGDNPVSVAVEAGSASPVAMNVECTALVGALEVTVTSTGEDIPDGYELILDGSPPQPMTANGSVSLTDLAVGVHTIELVTVPANCTVMTENPVSMTVIADEIAAAEFSVICSRILRSQLVFTRIEGGIVAICAINLDGTGFAQLADESIASDVSSDGTKILFTSPAPPGSTGNALWQMSADGSNAIQLTPETGSYRGARWSPDGSKIAYAHNVGGDFEIWVMNADGSGPVQLTNNEGPSDMSPSWSPDGSRIAFTTTRDGNREIYTMDADGANPMRLTNNLVDDMEPDWSPDGSMIVFAANRGPDILEIWVMNADGSNAVQLTDGLSVESGIEPSPAWSPDGTRIAFTAELNDNVSTNIGVMNADGSGILQLTAGHRDYSPLWRLQVP
jgi:TolB protein